MLEGRHALVLGGASRIGRAVALLFAEHGAEVTAADEVSGETERIFNEMAGASPDIKLFTLDFTSECIKRIRDSALTEFPRADILVSAADLYKTGETHNFCLKDFRRMLDVNFIRAVRCFQALLPGMLENRRGELILIAPDLTDSALPGTAAAAACAGAMAAFARNVTMDYIRYHVRANTILYPFIPGREPLTGAPEPLDAANAALWYACDLSRFVIGESLSVNGGVSYFEEAPSS
jgi:3-oxoacyl-[acyl-carrier protein] reductase